MHSSIYSLVNTLLSLAQYILQFSGRSDCCESAEVRLIPCTIYVDLHCATNCKLQSLANHELLN